MWVSGRENHKNLYMWDALTCILVFTPTLKKPKLSCQCLTDKVYTRKAIGLCICFLSQNTKGQVTAVTLNGGAGALARVQTYGFTQTQHCSFYLTPMSSPSSANLSEAVIKLSSFAEEEPNTQKEKSELTQFQSR